MIVLNHMCEGQLWNSQDPCISLINFVRVRILKMYRKQKEIIYRVNEKNSLIVKFIKR